MKVAQHVAWHQCNTMRLPCWVAYEVTVSTAEDYAAAAAVAQQQQLPLLPLGQGSNVLLPPLLSAVVLRQTAQCIELSRPQCHHCYGGY